MLCAAPWDCAPRSSTACQEEASPDGASPAGSNGRVSVGLAVQGHMRRWVGSAPECLEPGPAPPSAFGECVLRSSGRTDRRDGRTVISRPHIR